MKRKHDRELEDSILAKLRINFKNAQIRILEIFQKLKDIELNQNVILSISKITLSQ